MLQTNHEALDKRPSAVLYWPASLARPPAALSAASSLDSIQLARPKTHTLKTIDLQDSNFLTEDSPLRSAHITLGIPTAQYSPHWAVHSPLHLISLLYRTITTEQYPQYCKALTPLPVVVPLCSILLPYPILTFLHYPPPLSAFICPRLYDTRHRALHWR